MQRGKSALASFKNSFAHLLEILRWCRLAESGLRVPACASLLSGMETSPSQGVQVPMLADQDLEDMFLADTRARLGRVTLREHDFVASLPSII